MLNLELFLRSPRAFSRNVGGDALAGALTACRRPQLLALDTSIAKSDDLTFLTSAVRSSCKVPLLASISTILCLQLCLLFHPPC